jgi:hypothetical protein
MARRMRSNRVGTQGQSLPMVRSGRGAHRSGLPPVSSRPHRHVCRDHQGMQCRLYSARPAVTSPAPGGSPSLSATMRVRRLASSDSVGPNPSVGAASSEASPGVVDAAIVQAGSRAHNRQSRRPAVRNVLADFTPTVLPVGHSLTSPPVHRLRRPRTRCSTAPSASIPQLRWRCNQSNHGGRARRSPSLAWVAGCRPRRWPGSAGSPLRGSSAKGSENG